MPVEAEKIPGKKRTFLAQTLCVDTLNDRGLKISGNPEMAQRERI